MAQTPEQELRVMQLAAISTASLGNLPSDVSERIPRESEYWTPAYEDTCKAVDREIAWRKYAQDLKIYVFNIRNELGVKQPGYPAPVANACDIAEMAWKLQDPQDKILNPE